MFLSRGHHLGSGRSSGGRFDLDLWHWCIRAAEVSCLRLRVLCVVVVDGGLDGIFSQHRAVHCHLLVPCYAGVGEHYARLTGGRHSSLAISVFLIFAAFSKLIPRTSSVK